jgi:hypothetical protein
MEFPLSWSLNSFLQIPFARAGHGFPAKWVWHQITEESPMAK